MAITRDLKLCADSDEQRIVWAEVYAPNIPDSDGDFMDENGIRDMAYKFMKDGRLGQIDVQHTNELARGATVVESFIARKGDPDFIPGSWVVGIHIPDDQLWNMVKKGELNGFSMEAMVSKQPTTLDLEIPPVVSGSTTVTKSDLGVAHEHKFYVTFGQDGQFMGGRTDMVAGHYHDIRRGTVTEDAHGHNHRFSYVEGIRHG